MKRVLIALPIILIYVYSLINLNINMSQFFVFSLVIAAILIVINILFIKLKKIRSSKCNFYLNSYILLIPYMTLISMIHNFSGVGNYSLNVYFQDVISMIVLMGGSLLVFTKKSVDFVLSKYIKFISIIAIIAGVIAIYYADFSTGRISNVWQPQYILWRLLFPWSYLILYKFTIKNSNRILSIVAYTTSALYFILGFLFGKRILLYEAVVIIMLILLINKQKGIIKKFIKPIISVMGLLIVTLIISNYVIDIDLSNLFKSTITRYDNLSIGNFDRIEEFKNIFLEYPYSILLTGAGLGSYFHGPGVVSLHIGWLNFMFKGGILLFFLELWLFVKAIKMLLRSKDRRHIFIASSVVFGYLNILISSSWVSSPILLSYSIMKFALLRVLDEDSIKARAEKES